MAGAEGTEYTKTVRKGRKWSVFGSDRDNRFKMKPAGKRREEGAGYRVEGAGWRVEGRGCRVEGRGCRVEGRGCRVKGRGCRVQGAG